MLGAKETTENVNQKLSKNDKSRENTTEAVHQHPSAKLETREELTLRFKVIAIERIVQKLERDQQSIEENIKQLMEGKPIKWWSKYCNLEDNIRWQRSFLDYLLCHLDNLSLKDAPIKSLHSKMRHGGKNLAQEKQFFKEFRKNQELSNTGVSIEDVGMFNFFLTQRRRRVNKDYLAKFQLLMNLKELQLTKDEVIANAKPTQLVLDGTTNDSLKLIKCNLDFLRNERVPIDNELKHGWNEYNIFEDDLKRLQKKVADMKEKLNLWKSGNNTY